MMENNAQIQQSANLSDLSKESGWNSSFQNYFIGTWGAFLLIFVVGIVVYLPVFDHDFQTRWDDQWVAVNFYTDGGLSLKNSWYILSEYYHGQYAPMNQLYYSTLYELFGYNALAFHSAGLVFHLLNSCLVFVFVRKLLRLRKLGTLSKESSGLLALLTAIFFVIHPITVESVAWIAASKILIYAFFYLLALLAYLKYLEKSNWRYYGLTLVLFILSFGGKEQAVTLPLCLFLLDYLVGRNFKKRKIYIEKIPFLLLAIFFGLVTMWSQSAAGAGVLSTKAQYPIYQRLIFACVAYTEYLTKTLLPIKLSYIYPFPNQIGEPIPYRFWIYPFACIFGLFAVIRYLRNPWVLFWTLFFTLHIAITLHIIPIARFAITADRYVYVSLIASCFAVAYLFVYGLAQKKKLISLGVKVLLFFYIFYMAIYTNSRSEVWRNSETLKEEIRSIIKNREDYDLLMKQRNNN